MKLGEAEVHCRHFSIIRPYLTNDQRHPEEGAYEVVNEDTWRHHMSDLGQIEDDFHLRKVWHMLLLVSFDFCYRQFTFCFGVAFG